MTVHHFQRTQLIATPWKNGGGLTREVVRLPHDAAIDRFDWRVSMAEIGADGPFSPFKGVDRIIVLLDGEGVILRSDDGRIGHRLDVPLVPFAFSGDDVVGASLIGGASSDFNVMVRRGVADADMRLIRADAQLTSWEAGVLFTAAGRWEATTIDDDSGHDTGSIQTLDAETGIWWDNDPQSLAISTRDPNAAMIAVQIKRVRRHVGF